MHCLPRVPYSPPSVTVSLIPQDPAPISPAQWRMEHSLTLPLGFYSPEHLVSALVISLPGLAGSWGCRTVLCVRDVSCSSLLPTCLEHTLHRAVLSKCGFLFRKWNWSIMFLRIGLVGKLAECQLQPQWKSWKKSLGSYCSLVSVW